MRIHEGERRVSLSAREVAEFRLGPESRRGFTGQWRTALGTAWHRDLEIRTQSAVPDARFEVVIAGVLRRRNWTLEINGRIDQIIEKNGVTLLREVKTTSLPLPMAEEDLANAYPEYRRQIAVYCLLAGFSSAFTGEIRGELLFVSIGDGVMQTLPLRDDPAKLLETQLERITAFCEEQSRRRERLSPTEFKPAFAVFRPEQIKLQRELAESVTISPVRLLEAPTGFGKTGIALQHALERLRDGTCDRIIYLTGKSTGQHQAVRQLKAMIPAEGELRHFQLRSKREHSISTPRHDCTRVESCLEGIEDAWDLAGIDPAKLFEEGKTGVDDLRQLGALTGVCPFEIAKACLAFAEVWICDYNYVFSPGHRGVLQGVMGFDPAQTLLVIDEAHNLPSRVADNFSFSDTTAEAEALAAELRGTEQPYKLIKAADDWADFLATLKERDEHPATVDYEALDLLTHLNDAIQQTRLEPERLSPGSREHLFGFPSWRGFLADERFARLIWSPRGGALRVTYLSAAPHLADALVEYGSAVLMSATLSPEKSYTARLGMDAPLLRADAPWREDAYRIAIDCRVDTRYRSRASHYLETAETIHTLTRQSPSPVAVFFPSYHYAETVGSYVRQLDSLLRIAMQPRSVDLNGQLTFVEESLLTAHVLFFVLGSSFSESIDHLGGRIEDAMVVGPALPEVNPVQKAKLRQFEHLGREGAFREVYQLPAMTKINQALGRLVRAPGQRARVVLHCRRFAEQSYRELLAPEYTPEADIYRFDQLIAWLEGEV
ncbi:ATP-dependent DNA helicase [Cerasicoccus arenae]|uniref:ATP-dependent DNA helicase n=1 Tax=Cerasicoccus arenae TaxID=424488 RepID=UPI001906BA3F|nr:helicase C-terminal domain-containing protein [Cerasicoccus arenae]MBK1857394.1 PD-(D/E)XK nuclease family protein [Cerasicoccus arenae]